MARPSTCGVILLEGQFPLNPQLDQLFRVTVSNRHLFYVPSSVDDEGRTDGKSKCKKSSSGNCVLSFEDVIGCDCMKGKSGDVAAYLSIYAYPTKKNLVGKGKTRKRLNLTFVFGRSESFDKNFVDANRWKLVLSHLIRKAELKKLEDLNSLQCLPDRKLLVLVNPFSGPGKALHIFQRQVIPLFAEAGFKYHLIITEFAGHAKEIAGKLTLEEWYGIIIVSGDGLIFEVVNGLMERPDWENAIKMPIGTLPGGSGNALSYALLYGAGEPYMENVILHSTFLIAKHDVAPMDLVAVDTCSGKRLYSFLSVGWGIFADVDIESEKFRSIGNARFTLGALIRIMGLRKYRGRLSFLPVDSTYRPKNQRCRIPDGHQSSKYQSRNSGTDSVSAAAAPAASSGADDKADPNHENVTAAENTSISLEQGKDIVDRPPNATSNPPMVVTPLLSPLGEPVPADWITIEDEFVSLIAVYQTHISQGLIAAPESRLDDGVIYLYFTKGGISRIKLVQLFNALEDGKPPAADDLSSELVRVKAFRLEPLTEKGILTVDGEVVDYGPIQAQILPSIARIMTLRKNNVE